MGRVFCSMMIALAITGVAGAATYTWNGSSNDWTEPTAWNPTRTTVQSTDELVFSSDATITSLPAVGDGLRTLTITNNANVSLSTTSLSVAFYITGEGTAAFDLVIDAGSSLRFTGSVPIAIQLHSAATGDISGDVVFQSSGGNANHRILANGVGAVRIRNGATVAMAPGDTNGLGGFGTSGEAANGAVVFESGSHYYQGGEKDGTRYGFPGSSPFARAAPDGNVVFESGSSYTIWHTNPPMTGRTYGNFIWRNSLDYTTVGTGTAIIQNDFVNMSSGDVPQGRHHFNMTTEGVSLLVHGDFIIGAGGGGVTEGGTLTGLSTIELRGNVSIADAGGFTPHTSSNRRYLFSGSSVQEIGYAGATLQNVAVNNSAGVILTDDVTIANGLELTSGDIGTGASTLTLGAGASVSGSGRIFGNLARIVDGGSLGISTLPIGETPVSVDITSGGTGTGTFSVSTTGAPGANLPGGTIGINRTWSLNAVGISGYTATLTFTYLESELNGAGESDLVAARWSGSEWETLAPASTADSVSNSVTVTGVTQLSEWTLLAIAPPSSVPDWSILLY